MKRHRLPIRLLTLAACTITALTAGALTVGASPIGGNETAGACTDVALTITTQTSGPNRLTAPGGTCKEYDRSWFLFVRSGTLALFGDVLSCTGNASTVQASVTLAPTNPFTNTYAPVIVDIETVAGVSAIRMASPGLPPALVGTGVALADAGNTCTSATWSDGVIAWEDPVVESP